jgi:hypothetical protein
MFAVIISNIPRATRIAKAFEYEIGHNAPYKSVQGDIVFEINKSCRTKALEIIKNS